MIATSEGVGKNRKDTKNGQGWLQWLFEETAELRC